MELFDIVKKLTDDKCHPKFLALRNSLPIEASIVQTWSEGMIDRDGKFVREFQESFHSAFWEIYLYRVLINSGYSLNQEHHRPDFFVKNPEIFIEAVVANLTKEKSEDLKRKIESYQSPEKQILEKKVSDFFGKKGISEDELSSLKSKFSNYPKGINSKETAYGNVRNPMDILKNIYPPHLNDNFYSMMHNSIIRYSNAIHSKIRKYREEYINDEWVNVNTPFIIGMASYDDLNYGNEYIYPMIALLYGRYYDPEQAKYSQKNEIQKNTEGAIIKLGIFNNSEYCDISAIIFSCTLTLGKLTATAISHGCQSINNVYSIHENMSRLNPNGYNCFILKEVSQECPEELEEGLFVFHNPNAKNKLPDDFLSEVPVTHIYFENSGIMFSGNETPIVARCNTPFPIIKDIQEIVRKYNRMTPEDFYDIK